MNAESEESREIQVYRDTISLLEKWGKSYKKKAERMLKGIRTVKASLRQ